MSDWAYEKSIELYTGGNRLACTAAALREAYKAGQKQGEQDGEVADALAVTEKGYDDGFKAGQESRGNISFCVCRKENGKDIICAFHSNREDERFKAGMLRAAELAELAAKQHGIPVPLSTDFWFLCRQIKAEAEKL